MDIPADAAFMVQWTCQRCQGRGAYNRSPFCGQCGRDLTRAEIEAAWAEYDRRYSARPSFTTMSDIRIPCGHTLDDIREHDTCADCDGDGQHVRSITLRELAATLDALRTAVR